MAKVKFSFGSKGAFEKLSVKDPNTVYFVNETGDFSSASLDADGDIYLGEKLLTGGGDGGGSASIPAVAGGGSALQPNTLYQFGLMDRSLSVTLSNNFDESVKNEWHIVVIPAVNGLNLTINAPTISGYNCVVVGGDSLIGLKAGVTYDIRILYAGTVDQLPEYTGVLDKCPVKVFALTCDMIYYS